MTFVDGKKSDGCFSIERGKKVSALIHLSLVN
jgi:hypothetical protein